MGGFYEDIINVICIPFTILNRFEVMDLLARTIKVYTNC